MWQKQCDVCGNVIDMKSGHVEIRLDFLYDNMKVVVEESEEYLITWKHKLDICEKCYPKFIKNMVRNLRIIPDKWLKYCNNKNNI